MKSQGDHFERDNTDHQVGVAVMENQGCEVRPGESELESEGSFGGVGVGATLPTLWPRYKILNRYYFNIFATMQSHQEPHA
jgi:hypothetical protein